jgi:hypothetical protein
LNFSVDGDRFGLLTIKGRPAESLSAVLLCIIDVFSLKIQSSGKSAAEI